MAIEIIKVDEKEKWNKIVQSFENHDVYYLNGYAKACKVNGDGEPLLIYFDNGTTRAINVVIKRDIADDDRFKDLIEKGEYFDLVTPYGYGGFIIEGENYKELDDEYSEVCTKEGIVSEFVRFHPILKNCEKLKNLYEINLLGNTVAIELNDENSIWQNIKSKNRNCVRKAKISNIEIHSGNSNEDVNNFIDLYEKTMKHLKADDIYYFKKKYYEIFQEELKENWVIFNAKLEDQIIASSLILFANGKMHYHLSASLKEYNHIAPTNLMIYEVALYGLNRGYKEFHLGGGVGAQKDNLYKFKKSFYKGNDKDFAIGKKIFDEVKYSFLLRTMDIKNEGNSYFPQYRG